MDIKIVCNEDNKYISQINDSIKTINGLQKYFFYFLENEEVDNINDLQKPLNWSAFKHNHSNAQNKIYITERPFDDNWFSHEERKFSIITVSDWEQVFSPPSLKCYLIYQIAQASINFEADINEDMEMRMVHQRAEGCLFDFCVQKSDIKLGMLAGCICPTCKATLLRYGIFDSAIDAIERMIDYVRSSAIGKIKLCNFHDAFVVMRFTENDENDNAYKYGICDALKKLGINVNRADKTIESGQILKKIVSAIKRDRFIIIKVDSNNLNVYFELGLAMGLNKDILLICEQGAIKNLPSDLNNFECLTYKKGNYEMLSEKIIKFFNDNYHIDSLNK